jgi:hypothetical protein
MLRGRKSTEELRFELLIWGIILITGAVIYVTVYDVLPSLILVIPGLILLGAAIFQDMQADWHAGWPVYVLAILVVATGLAALVNDLTAQRQVPWLVIAIVELGAIFIVKAVYDPTPR